MHSIENVSQIGSYTRVAHELLFCVNEFGEETADGMRLTLPLTHQDIGDILGLTRETVTKVIVRLRDQGIVTDDRRICVRNLDALRAAAYH